MTLSNSLPSLALATLLAAPASAQCDCGDPLVFTTDTQVTEVIQNLGSAPFPRMPMISLPQFDVNAAAAEHQTSPAQVNLICARVEFEVNIVPTGTLMNGPSACTASWDYDVQVAIYQNMQVPVPGSVYPSANSGMEPLKAGGSAILSMSVANSSFVYTATTNLMPWIGTGDLVWEGDAATFQSVTGCGGITASFSNAIVSTATVTYTYCVPFDPTPGGPGTPVCFGDGSGSPCACGNNGGAGAGCRNSTGNGTLLGGSGVASFAADTLALEATMTTNQPGVFFQGNVTLASPTVFGAGIRCCGQGVVRVITVNAQSNCASSNQPAGCGEQVGGVGGPISQHPGNRGLSPGDTRCYQFWYRDPGAGNPCAGTSFNLSNGYSVTWGA